MKKYCNCDSVLSRVPGKQIIRLFQSQQRRAKQVQQHRMSSKISMNSLNLKQSYNERIRPLLDGVDTVRKLGVVKEGIRLPTIVVIGDQSSGKSSVLESLAGISLPTGEGICTRVPLIMRLQRCQPQDSEIVIEYRENKRTILETEIKQALDTVTEEIAGRDKALSDTPITLHVSKPDAPDLTMVDLPGITRVPVHGQPPDIYEQITRIIKEYITPEESIILNVLSATVDFPTCESINMSREVDPNGQRTLAVVTKVDRAPEGLFEKVTVDAVNIGHGYVCVRNRIGCESNAEARQSESDLFRTNPYLSRIDKSMVGIPVLAEKLMHIQAMGIRNCLPDVVKKIDITLSNRQSQLNALPRHFSNSAEAMVEFMKVMDAVKGILNKITLMGDFEDFEDESQMDFAPCLCRKFKSYFCDLLKERQASGNHFLYEELVLMEEAQGITLPNFLPHPAFMTLLKKQIDSVFEISRNLAIDVCEYLDKVVCRVIDIQTERYPKLQSASRKAFQALIERKKHECIRYVEEMMEMEKSIVLSMSTNYSVTQSSLQEKKKVFVTAIEEKKSKMTIEGMGEINLDEVPKESDLLGAAFELKISLIAYWNVVRTRIGDQIPLHLRFITHKLVKNEIVAEIVKEVTDQGLQTIEHVLEQSPAILIKRKNLNSSVNTLRESKSVLASLLGSYKKLNINND